MRVSPSTAKRTFLYGFHNVIRVSAATARTEPSPENAAAVIGFFLQQGTEQIRKTETDFF